jgi:hypothetical protein
MITLLVTFFILFFSATSGGQGDTTHRLKQDLMLQLKTKLEHAAHPKVATPVRPATERRPDDQLIQNTQNVKKQPTTWSVEPIGSQMVINFEQISFFKFASTQLSYQGKSALRQFAPAFKPFASEYQILIRAFTDDKPVRSFHVDYKNNLELSTIRALHTAEYLTGLGIPLNRLRLAGFGESTYGKNTRVEKKAKPSTQDSSHDRGNPLARRVTLTIEPLGRP